MAIKTGVLDIDKVMIGATSIGKIYQGTNLIFTAKKHLYFEGDEFTSVTGGFVYDWGNTGYTFQKNATHMYFVNTGTNNSGTVQLRTNNPVDVTKFNKITMRTDLSHKTTQGSIGLRLEVPGAFRDAVTSENGENLVFSLDVSDITGAYPFRIVIRRTSPGNVFSAIRELYLEL